MAQPTSVPVPLERSREQVILQLCQHFAADHLTDSALEERLDRANAALTVVELNALVSDLPAIQSSTTPARMPAPSTGVAVGSWNADRQIIVGIMGGAERKGAWSPPRSLTVVALMGGVELDLREAHLAPGVTEINVFAIMGGAEIIVPPGVHVDMSGMAIMGGFGQRGMADSPADASAPILRIGGFCMMGGVEVSIRHAGERASDAKKREKLSRELARLDRKRLHG